MGAALPLAAAAQRLAAKRGRPPLSDEERSKRKAARDARRAAQLAAVAPRLFSVSGSAKYIGVSPWTVRGLIAAGILPKVTIPAGDGRDLRLDRIDREDLDRLIAAWKETGR